MSRRILRFSSDRGSASHCPCGKGNHDGKFSPYEGYTDKGYCFGCGETFLPGAEKPGKRLPPGEGPTTPFMSPKQIIGDALLPSYVPHSVFRQSIGRYDENVLLVFLSKLTNPETAARIRDDYRIGTAMFWKGSTVFWQIDVDGNIRNGKIIQYAMRPDDDSSIGLNCGRVKTSKPPVKWVHKLPGLEGFQSRQCFFGAHLLSEFPNRKVGILESEKSCLIAAAYHPGTIWLACGGADGLSEEKAGVLQGRNVTLFPDLGKYDLWNQKSDNLHRKLSKTQIKISDVLERGATAEERGAGLDLADFLIRHEWSSYGKPNTRGA